jgi:hypothetical protein
MNIIDTAKLEEPAPVVDPFTGAETVIFDESMIITADEATDFFNVSSDPASDLEAARDQLLGEGVPDTLNPPGEQLSLVPVEPQAEAPAAPKNRRRSRCKECGNLHYKTDPCTSSESV